MRYYIVWNESKTEGFITNDESDAHQCLLGVFDGITSAAGEAFYEMYEDDERSLQEVDL